MRISADINWDTLTRTEEKFDPDGQVVRSSVINDEDTDSSTAAPAAAAPPPPPPANALADTGVTNPVAAVPMNNSRTKKKVTNNSYEINKATSTLMQAAGGIKRLSSAVFVAQRFDPKDHKPVPRSPEELLKLRHIVQSALGIQDTADASRKDEITLEEMPFNDQPVSELGKQIVQQEKFQMWVEVGQRAIYPAMALGVLGLFWRAVKRAKPDEIPIGYPVGNGNGNGNGHYGRPGAPAGGVVTAEVLNQLIRENPVNMTQSVRSWLTRTKPNN